MKTLKLFLIVTLLSVSGLVKAQDVILKKDSSTIISKVTKISSTEIEYKKWSNLDGPTYTINISEVLSINYSNGEVEHFNQQKPIVTPTAPTTPSPKVFVASNDNPPQYGKGKLAVTRKNKLTLDGRALSDNEAMALLGKEAYEEYCSGKKLWRTSNTMDWIYMFVAPPSILGVIIGSSSGNPIVLGASIAGLNAALACMILDGVFAKIGGRKIAEVINNYNEHNLTYSIRPSILNLETPMQIQNNYNFGLTFSLNF